MGESRVQTTGMRDSHTRHAPSTLCHLATRCTAMKVTYRNFNNFAKSSRRCAGSKPGAWRIITKPFGSMM